jgi:hypothetical protein
MLDQRAFATITDYDGFIAAIVARMPLSAASNP